jgi:hypothetical protein
LAVEHTCALSWTGTPALSVRLLVSRLTGLPIARANGVELKVTALNPFLLEVVDDGSAVDFVDDAMTVAKPKPSSF